MYLTLSRRQMNGDFGDDNINHGDDNIEHGDDYWGYSDTAVAIKWAFVGAIILLFLLWFVGGYYHAQRRIKQGLPPMRYHRFLLPYRQRMQYMPRHQYGNYPPQNAYGEDYPMQPYPAPPPAYHAEHIPPPVYQPPEGGSKVNPSQDWASPPPGPPPAVSATVGSSNAMHNVPLNQTSVSQESSEGELPARPKKQGMMSRLNPFKGNSPG